MKRLFLYAWIVIGFGSCAAQFEVEKINGVSFVASRQAIDSTHIDPILNVNANFAAIMPFGFIRDLNEPEIMFDTDRQWYGERISGAQQYIRELKKNGIKIMLKPQLWVGRGHYTGHIFMDDDLNWKTLEDSYSKFVLDFARLAQQEQVEILCIGTELEKFVSERPEYWKKLIDEIKSIYSGKLTYAANWDECSRVPFWDQLDYIGVDAYFPLSVDKTPSVEDCRLGWDEHLSMIEKLYNSYNKPVLFSEYGYRSVDFAAKEPWNSDRTLQDVNLVAQQNAYEALYDTFWTKRWFAGGFLWKWFVDHESAGGEDNHQFTPQNKPVEKLIKQIYGN